LDKDEIETWSEFSRESVRERWWKEKESREEGERGGEREEREGSVDGKEEDTESRKYEVRGRYGGRRKKGGC